MDFADESYVRKYPRKTLTSRLLGWEGRAVMDAMLGEFDAAGIFAIRGDAAQCISVVTEIPIEFVRVALTRLIETETWVVTERVITWPTYEEAQNCTRSDRIRQRESRRARSLESVTNCHKPSQAVTASHSPSQNVTLPPSAPSLSTPSLLPLDPPVVPQGDAPEPKPKRAKAKAKLPADFAPIEADRSLAAEEGVSLQVEFPKFIDHHSAKGTLSADWRASLRYWLRNSKRFSGPIRGSPGASNAQAGINDFTRSRLEKIQRLEELEKQEAAR